MTTDERLLDKRMVRNMHPHAEAFLAMLVLGHEYSKQSGGCMDFWDKQDAHTKEQMKEMVDKLLEKKRWGAA